MNKVKQKALEQLEEVRQKLKSIPEVERIVDVFPLLITSIVQTFV